MSGRAALVLTVSVAPEVAYVWAGRVSIDGFRGPVASKRVVGPRSYCPAAWPPIQYMNLLLRSAVTRSACRDARNDNATSSFL